MSACKEKKNLEYTVSAALSVYDNWMVTLQIELLIQSSTIALADVDKFISRWKYTIFYITINHYLKCCEFYPCL